MEFRGHNALVTTLQHGHPAAGAGGSPPDLGDQWTRHRQSSTKHVPLGAQCCELSGAELWGQRAAGAETVTGLLRRKTQHYQGIGEFYSHSCASSVIIVCC